MAAARGKVSSINRNVSIDRNVDRNIHQEGTYGAVMGDKEFILTLPQLNRLVPGKEFIFVYQEIDGRRKVSRLADVSSLKTAAGPIKTRNDGEIKLDSGEKYSLIEGIDVPAVAKKGALATILYSVEGGKNVGWEITVA